ncbi:MAG TPA: NmrA family NAD(P)-binding protein [Myxococcales bacterium]|jgi:uncharacterized protein YbjT (DUF2867 family)
MSILVTGGTGTVGSKVVRELLVRKADVSVLTRDASKATALPSGVRAVEGNLHDADAVRRIFRGIDTVFLVTTVGPTEATDGLMAITAVRVAGVRRIVYLSVHGADKAAWLPHFGSKVGIEAALKVSGIAFSVLRPNNFFQNDYWFKDAIVKHGVYPQPIGSAGLSRVDVRDIAEAAAILLTEPGHDGQFYDVVGPEQMTGPRTAEIWSGALGRPVAYGGDDLDAWEKQMLQFTPPATVFDFRYMYDYFQKEGLKASAQAIARQTKLLGHAPRRFEAFAAETAAVWTGPEVRPEVPM